MLPSGDYESKSNFDKNGILLAIMNDEGVKEVNKSLRRAW
jgi:hypothetical protein